MLGISSAKKENWESMTSLVRHFSSRVLIWCQKPIKWWQSIFNVGKNMKLLFRIFLVLRSLSPCLEEIICFIVIGQMTYLKRAFTVFWEICICLALCFGGKYKLPVAFLLRRFGSYFVAADADSLRNLVWDSFLVLRETSPSEKEFLWTAWTSFRP